MACSDPLADMAALQQGHSAAILLGTPGRLMDMLQRSELLDMRALEVGWLDNRTWQIMAHLPWQISGTSTAAELCHCHAL